MEVHYRAFGATGFDSSGQPNIDYKKHLNLKDFIMGEDYIAVGHAEDESDLQRLRY